MHAADILHSAAKLILQEDKNAASKLVRQEYPFTEYVKPKAKPKRPGKEFVNAIDVQAQERKYTQKQALQLFLADGFINRYSGEKLICPSALYAISTAIPDAFPCGDKRSNTHQAFWDLFPSLDHFIPVSCGGEDTEKNWVTTSMTMNLKKSNVSFDELGWTLHPSGNREHWDGLASWYVQWAASNPHSSTIRFNKAWHKASIALFTGPYPTAA